MKTIDKYIKRKSNIYFLTVTILLIIAFTLIGMMPQAMEWSEKAQKYLPTKIMDVIDERDALRFCVIVLCVFGYLYSFGAKWKEDAVIAEQMRKKQSSKKKR